MLEVFLTCLLVLTRVFIFKGRYLGSAFPINIGGCLNLISLIIFATPDRQGEQSHLSPAPAAYLIPRIVQCVWKQSQHQNSWKLGGRRVTGSERRQYMGKAGTPARVTGTLVNRTPVCPSPGHLGIRREKEVWKFPRLQVALWGRCHFWERGSCLMEAWW